MPMQMRLTDDGTPFAPVTQAGGMGVAVPPTPQDPIRRVKTLITHSRLSGSSFCAGVDVSLAQRGLVLPRRTLSDMHEP
jgi:hypothetical protein